MNMYIGNLNSPIKLRLLKTRYERIIKRKDRISLENELKHGSICDVIQLNKFAIRLSLKVNWNFFDVTSAQYQYKKYKEQ